MVIIMNIKKASIQGPCKGVIEAIKQVNNLLSDDSTKHPIYMLGRLVHNEHISNAYKSKGVIILDGKPRLDLVKTITEGTVIITAHGVSDEVYDYLSRKGIAYLDTTCSYVTKSKQIIKSYLSCGYKVIYLGVHHHPECEAIMAINKNITLLNYQDAINKNYRNIQEIGCDEKCILTCQTTLSFQDVLEIYNEIKLLLPNLELASEVCSATRLRQSALIRECINQDLCLVVGDKYSNNTKSLKEVCINYLNTPCEQVENVEELKNIDFKKYSNIFITSGASTPKVIVDEIVFALENNLPFKSNIRLDDYIKINKSK